MTARMALRSEQSSQRHLLSVGLGCTYRHHELKRGGRAAASLQQRTALSNEDHWTTTHHFKMKFWLES
eukprot:2058421-Amphidinium_carterae.1